MLALGLVKNVDPRFLFQFELIRIPRLAGTNQPLPFRRTGNVLNVSPVAVGEAEVLHHVLHAATWTFHVKAGFRHRILIPVREIVFLVRAIDVWPFEFAVRARIRSAAHPVAEVADEC